MRLDMEDWAQLAAAYKLHDETRENVIKRCRDMQVRLSVFLALHE